MTYADVMNNIAKIRAGAVHTVLAEQRKIEEQKMKQKEGANK